MLPTVILTAAEASGDLLAAELLRALQARGPVRALGIAGPAMRAAGVEPLGRVEELSVMGAAELLGRIGALRAARRAVLGAIRAGAQAFVGVDSPDFHLPLARAARAAGLPAVGVVSPQIWAWRPGRAAKIAASLDRLLCLFAFEPALYSGLDARFIGHPALDRYRPRDQGSVDPDLFALLPGSRPAELKRLLPVFLATAERVRAARPAARFLWVRPPSLAHLPAPPGVSVVPSLAEAASARAALTKSGTVTLELARLGMPQVVAYRVHPLTYAIGRLLVRGVRHVALPNVLWDRRHPERPAAEAPVPEHLQRLDPAALARDLLALPERQPIKLDDLGTPGVAARAAEAVAALWEGR